MTTHVTTKLARLGSRLEGLGRRHKDLEQRIEAVQQRPQPDHVALQRLKRAKLRLKDEMQCYEGLLRNMTQRIAS